MRRDHVMMRMMSGVNDRGHIQVPSRRASVYEKAISQRPELLSDTCATHLTLFSRRYGLPALRRTDPAVRQRPVEPPQPRDARRIDGGAVRAPSAGRDRGDRGVVPTGRGCEWLGWDVIVAVPRASSSAQHHRHHPVPPPPLATRAGRVDSGLRAGEADQQGRVRPRVPGAEEEHGRHLRDQGDEQARAAAQEPEPTHPGGAADHVTCRQPLRGEAVLLLPKQEPSVPGDGVRERWRHVFDVAERGLSQRGRGAHLRGGAGVGAELFA